MASTLTRWDPFAEFADLRGRFDRLLDELGPARERDWMPAIDMVRDDGHLVVRADVPGMKPEEIKIEAHEGVLTISGEHEETKETEDKQYVHRERRFGSFSRSMALPKGVDATKITANTREGVLEVTIPLPKETVEEPVTITPTVA